MISSEDRCQAECEFRQLRDVLPQYISVYGSDGTPLYANDELLEFFGFTLDDFRADDFQAKAFHPDDVERVRTVHSNAMSRGEGWEIEARILRKDGQFRWFLIRGKALRDGDGNIVRWFSSGTDIEDRKRAQWEIDQLVDAVPQHLVVLSGDGRRLYANKTVRDYHGMTLQEFLAEEVPSHCFHPDDVALYMRSHTAGIASGQPWEAEARLRRKDGQYRWFLYRANPLRDEQGVVIRWYISRTDIEDRKQADRELQQERDRLHLLLEFTNRLAAKLDLNELLRSVVDSVHRMIPCDLVAVFLPTPDAASGQLRSFVVEFPARNHREAGVQIHAMRPPTPLEQKVADDVLRSGTAYTGTARELFQPGPASNSETLVGQKGYCVFPVVCCDSVLGVVAVARPEECTFSKDDLNLLQQVVSQMAIELNNALVVEARNQAEDALRRSQAYLAEAQRLSHSGSWGYDIHREEITHWSEETYRAFGFDPKQGPVPYPEARKRIHPEDLQLFDKTKAKAIKEHTAQEYEFRVLLPEGGTKYIHCICRAVTNASAEAVELVGTVMDITERHQARVALEKAFEEIKQLKDALLRENLALKEEVDQASMFEEIVGTSDVLKRVLLQVSKVAPTDSTVLISGETGTGKELIARAIHKRSQRSERAFVAVNCAAIPASLIGSELFGHEKGAFTGATQRRLGRFELADGGTLFLDEIEDLPAETQIALLRVLQDRRFERIGGTQSITANVRIIAATNRDLKAAVGTEALRNDLYYRLNVFPIAVPPLRARKEDIPLLVEYLIERYASKAGKKITTIHRRTMELFQTYDWPGNIRELQNVVERAVILCDGETFSVDESWLQAEMPRSKGNDNGLARLGANREREIIEAALAETGGRVAGPLGAAAKLGIPRSTLETKIKKLGIKKHRFDAA
jgi:PAS domain S-box-containing protein